MKKNINIAKFVKGFKSGLKKSGSNFGIIINSLVLLIVYFFGVGLTFLIAKIFGKEFLDTKIDQEKETYWSELNLSDKTDDFYRQF